MGTCSRPSAFLMRKSICSRPSLYSRPGHARDRKSTRLNSSHSQISYAVFCLKIKNGVLTTLRIIPLTLSSGVRLPKYRVLPLSTLDDLNYRDRETLHIRYRYGLINNIV